MTTPNDPAPAAAVGDAAGDAAYWCRACDFSTFDADAAIWHHEQTGHHCTHRPPAHRAAPAHPATTAGAEEVTEEDVLRAIHAHALVAGPLLGLGPADLAIVGPDALAVM